MKKSLWARAERLSFTPELLETIFMELLFEHNA
jgi:hypothetical protein